MTSTTSTTDTVPVPGFCVYAFPIGTLPNNAAYFNHTEKAVGYATYFGTWPIDEVPQNMKDAYPGCDYVSSPRTWQVPASEIDDEMRQWLNAIAAEKSRR